MNKPPAVRLFGEVGARPGGKHTLECDPSDVGNVCSKIRDAGFDFLSFVTAVERGDSFEVVYHMRNTGEWERLFLKTEVPRDEASLPTVSDVWRAANWHEREVYDLFGVEFDGHPKLERIILHENWVGHPLRKDYEEREQDITLDMIDLVDDEGGEDHDVMYVNVGPQHPAAHGVARIQAAFDGEMVEKVNFDIGFMHRGVEKLCETFEYRQIVPYYDRMDWTGPSNVEGAYVRAVEELLEVEAPPRAQYLRVIASELGRITGHLIGVGQMAMDLTGMTGVIFMYCWREREKALDLLDMMTGGRLTHNYMTIGGTRYDLSEGLEEKALKFTKEMREAIVEYHSLTTENEVFRARTVGTGVMDGDLMLDWGVTGPSLRGSGVDYDLRRDDPYFLYEDFDFDVITYPDGGNYDRFEVRMDEMEESCRIIEQALDEMPGGDHQAKVPKRLRADGEHYAAVEAPKGEFGTYIVADGTNKPQRLKIRTPSFSNIACVEDLVRGEKIPDLVVGFASLDPVFGEVDR
ncbi:MAG: NADH-quinone oxidoreductase subunit C/D [Methanonatronarchaeales archaeon]|nr:NADH-quinone oxidoreductase subunit C/D [Methanonatronarchaeales archaeon]